MFPAFHLLEREAFFDPRAADPSVVLQGSCRVTDALPCERKERGSKEMNTLVIVLIAAVCLLGAYTFYGRWLANICRIVPIA